MAKESDEQLINLLKSVNKELKESIITEDLVETGYKISAARNMIYDAIRELELRG